MILRRGYEFTTGYRLQEYLGKGQFGEVWRASGPGGVVLAAKFVGLEGGRGQKEYEAIRRVKSIRHANLMPITAIWQLDEEGNLIEDPPEDIQQTVDLFDVDSRGQSGFVVAPGPQASTLIVGMTLGDASLEKYLPKDKRAPEERTRIPTGELLKYMEGTARGLDFLNSPNHDFGNGPVSLQHCDVKPANIVLVGDSAVVCDFGLARILAKNQVTMTNPSGTPAYMSPEAIDGKPSRTSDQYSLAVTYYHLRTGTLPLNDTDSVHQVLRAHISGSLDFGRLPTAEQEILRRATSGNWQQRFESNSHFVAAIRDALTHQGIDTSGQASHSSVIVPTKAKKPVPGPSGPAAQGIESYDNENLTGGVVQHSKGGSPIISGVQSSNVQSHETWMPGSEPASQDGRLTDDLISQDIQPTFETSDVRVADKDSPAHPLASVPDALNLRAAPPEPAGATTPSQTSPVWMNPRVVGLAASLLAAIAISGFWMTRSAAVATIEVAGDASGDDDGKTSDADLLAKAVSLIDGDLDDAKDAFASAVGADSSLLRVPYEIESVHTSEFQRLLPVTTLDGFVTTGFDRTPMWWKVATPSKDDPKSFTSKTSGVGGNLKRTVLTELEAPMSDAPAIQVSIDESWLFAGSSQSVVALPLAKVKSTSSSGFPIPPTKRWNVEGSVVAVAVHPTQPNLVIVATTDDDRLSVFDATAPASDGDAVAETRITDVVEDLRFVASGELLLVQYKSDMVVAMKWSDLRSNELQRSEVPTQSFDVDDCELLDPSPGAIGNRFWIGHGSGVISEYRIEDVATNEINRQTKWDWISQGPINAMAIGRDATGGASFLVTGSGDSSVAITRVASPTEPSILRLDSGPVRCVALSEDQNWFAAGVSKSVWVGSINDPTKWNAQLSIGNVSAECLRIDAANNLLIIGCSDGSLVTMNWTHAKLRSLVEGPSNDSQNRQPDTSQPNATDQRGRAI